MFAGLILAALPIPEFQSAQVRIVVAKGARGRKYLKTEADNDTSDTLMKLPAC